MDENMTRMASNQGKELDLTDSHTPKPTFTWTDMQLVRLGSIHGKHWTV